MATPGTTAKTIRSPVCKIYDSAGANQCSTMVKDEAAISAMIGGKGVRGAEEGK